MGSSRDRLPAHVWNEIRRDAEFPDLVAREREAERLEAERRAARAASRRHRFLTADALDEDLHPIDIQAARFGHREDQ